VIGKSGVCVYNVLHTWNGTDLNQFCPGSSVPIQNPLLATQIDKNTKLALGLGFGSEMLSTVLLGVL
jgi:hypothetical protein